MRLCKAAQPKAHTCEKSTDAPQAPASPPASAELVPRPTSTDVRSSSTVTFHEGWPPGPHPISIARHPQHGRPAQRARCPQLPEPQTAARAAYHPALSRLIRARQLYCYPRRLAPQTRAARPPEAHPRLPEPPPALAAMPWTVTRQRPPAARGSDLRPRRTARAARSHDNGPRRLEAQEAAELRYHHRRPPPNPRQPLLVLVLHAPD